MPTPPQPKTTTELPGVTFRPHFFQPTFQKHAGALCGGFQLHVTDRDTYCSYRTGIAVIKVLRRLFPDGGVVGLC